jgi:dihydropyrimidinase
MIVCDALVRGGRVVLPEATAPLEIDIAIKDGRVLALLEPGALAEADWVWEAAGQIVMPGAIDPHVHVSWPYLDSRTCDDYATATRAAATGGTTTIIDFAIEGRESPLEALKARRSQAEGQAVIDYSFHLVISDATPQVLDELPDVVAEGVTSFKLYMTYRRRGLAVSDATLTAVARRAAELGAVVGVHAEDADQDDAGTARMRELGRGAPRYLPHAKPPRVEADAIVRAAELVAGAGGRLWILHLSSKAGLEAALEARRSCGQPEALETCPQYMLLDESYLSRLDGQRFLCSPPLRRGSSQRALWDGLKGGTIDWIGTDHCLFLSEQKDARSDRFWNCPHGLPGIQTRPMLMLHNATERGIELPAVARMLSAAAARWFGLYPRKGTLLPGSDADLVLWDPSARWTIGNDALAMGGDWTPYEGFQAWAPPSLVLVRGRPVVAPAGATVHAGHGQFLARPLKRVTVQA